jgi:hypothetical protein
MAFDTVRVRTAFDTLSGAIQADQKRPAAGYSTFSFLS